MMYYVSSKAIPKWPLWTSGVNHPSFCPIKISGTSLKQFSSWACTLFGFQGVNGYSCKDQEGFCLQVFIVTQTKKLVEAFHEDLLSLSRWERYSHFWNGICKKKKKSSLSDNSLVSNSAVICTLTLTWKNQWFAQRIFQPNQMSILKYYIAVISVIQPLRQGSSVAWKRRPVRFVWPEWLKVKSFNATLNLLFLIFPIFSIFLPIVLLRIFKRDVYSGIENWSISGN